MSYDGMLAHIKAACRMHFPDNLKDLIDEQLPRNCEEAEQKE